MRNMVTENLNSITGQIENLRKSLDIHYPVRLVAVSKIQNIEKIRAAYEVKQLHFGENYVDELVEKAGQLDSDIQWHMIGRLQSNKVKTLLSVSNLYLLETLDSISLAKKLQKKCNQLNRNLNVLVQVNTSGEGSKSGIPPEESFNMIQFIVDNCTNLHFQGLMTIGMHNQVNDFIVLRELRREIASRLGLLEETLDLSMGMSSDYVQAIEHGSTSVRIGTSIFGERHYTN